MKELLHSLWFLPDPGECLVAVVICIPEPDQDFACLTTYVHTLVDLLGFFHVVLIDADCIHAQHSLLA